MIKVTTKYLNIIIVISFISITILICTSCFTQKYKRGGELYKTHCAACHQDDGKGLAKLYPPLNGADYWVENQKKLPCIIKYGIKDTLVINGIKYDTPMQGISELTEYEISNIINYINHKWHPTIEPLNINEIKAHLNNCD